MSESIVIELLSSDCKSFTVKTFELSSVLRDMIVDCSPFEQNGPKEIIPLPFSSEYISVIADYLNGKSIYLNESIDIHKLLKVADFLGIDPLINDLCERITNQLSTEAGLIYAYNEKLNLFKHEQINYA
jgi:hypothetical protein